MRLGFIGTGKIGNPMARRLLGAGHDLTVFDLREQAASKLLELGALWAGSPAAVASQVEVVFTSLPGPVEAEQVALADDGVLAGARPGTIYFDLTTNAPTVARRLAAQAAARGVTYLDAPVSGGTAIAEKGEVTITVGGDRAAFEAHRSLLEVLGRNIYYLGEAGTGSIVKLVNNLIVFATPHLINEALVAGVKAGIDARTLAEVLAGSTASPFVSGVPRLLERRFDEATFTLELATKDIGLAVAMGRELGVPMPMAAAAEQAMLAASGAGFADKQANASLLALEAWAGVRVE